MSDVGKSFDEYSDDTNGAKERVNFGEVSARTPVSNFVDPSRIWDAAFGCTNVTYHGDLMGTQKQFLPEKVPL